MALAFIRRHYSEDIGVDDVANAVGTGRRHLERRFQNEIGTGIYQHILRTRVDEVSQLGRNTQGVRVIKLREGEKLVGIARIVDEDDEVKQDEEDA
jgi:transcriptional regulator GlxA family with amidase domain